MRFGHNYNSFTYVTVKMIHLIIYPDTWTYMQNLFFPLNLRIKFFHNEILGMGNKYTHYNFFSFLFRVRFIGLSMPSNIWSFNSSLFWNNIQFNIGWGKLIII